MKLIDELDDSVNIPVPAISICPYKPLDPEKLIQKGIYYIFVPKGIRGKNYQFIN